MSARLNPFAAAPEMIAAMTAFETGPQFPTRCSPAGGASIAEQD